MDLRQWRLNEIAAGQRDPGRPNFLDSFSLPFTKHRWHYRGIPFANRTKLYYAKDCPGVHPHSDNPFPIIPTLLSIPFSLLHTYPRLCGILPRTQYQHQLIIMAEEIIILWSWDPSPEEIEMLTVHATQDPRRVVQTPQPRPIRDHQDLTFDDMRHLITSSTATGIQYTARSAPDGTFELASGQVVISVLPHLSWESGTRLQLSDGDGEQLDMDTNYKETDFTDQAIATFYEGFSETSVSFNESREWQDPEEKTRDQCSSRSDIVAWSNMITDENESTSSKVTPLIPAPF